MDLELLKSELKKVKGGNKISSDDLKKFADYLEANGASSILSTDVLSTFLNFAKDIGFPATFGMVGTNLGTPKHSAPSVVTALKGAKILDTYKVAGGMMKDFIRRDWKEDAGIKKAPSREITVYDYHPDFVGEMSDLFDKLNLKSESREIFMDSKEVILEAKSVLADLEKHVNAPIVSEASLDNEEGDFFKNMDDEDVMKFADGLLLVLGELEAEGKIKKFAKPADARNALLAAVRKLYQSRGMLGKEARKYQRFGSERVLRTAKRDIGRAQSNKGKKD